MTSPSSMLVTTTCLALIGPQIVGSTYQVSSQVRVSAAMSMGTDETEAELEMRGQNVPGLARVFTAWHGITRPEPGRTMAPFWINTEQEGRKAVQELAAKKVDIVKIWVDDRDGKFPKVTKRVGKSPPQYAEE